MAESLEGRVRLGGFEINLRSGELWPAGAVNGDGKLLLREQPFQVLRMLIDRGGKMVTREEIRKKLWPNDTFVDFDHGINMAIGVLRRALGDSADNPQYIETLARRGYRAAGNNDRNRPGWGRQPAGIARTGRPYQQESFPLSRARCHRWRGHGSGLQGRRPQVRSPCGA